MSFLAQLLLVVLYVFLVLLVGRIVLDYVQMFARDWRPRGAALVVAEAVYSSTDPPVKALRRVIPPLRLGSVAIDLSFLVLFIGVWILIQLVYLLL